MLAPRKKLWSTPPEVLEKALELLDLRGGEGGDVLYDIGCGEGRVIIEAARRCANLLALALALARAPLAPSCSCCSCCSWLLLLLPALTVRTRPYGRYGARCRPCAGRVLTTCWPYADRMLTAHTRPSGRYGVRCVGVDIEEPRVEEARRNIAEASSMHERSPYSHLSEGWGGASMRAGTEHADLPRCTVVVYHTTVYPSPFSTLTRAHTHMRSIRPTWATSAPSSAATRSSRIFPRRPRWRSLQTPAQSLWNGAGLGGSWLRARVCACACVRACLAAPPALGGCGQAPNTKPKSKLKRPSRHLGTEALAPRARSAVLHPTVLLLSSPPCPAMPCRPDGPNKVFLYLIPRGLRIILPYIQQIPRRVDEQRTTPDDPPPHPHLRLCCCHVEPREWIGPLG